MPVQYQASNVELPWLAGPYQNLLQRSQDLSHQHAVPYPAPRVAPIHQYEDLLRAEEIGRQTGQYLPYLQQAEQFAQRGAQGFPENFQAYQNPYMQAVVNRIGEEGQRNIQERIMPSLAAQFSGLGQFGSMQHQRFLQRALRDMQGEIANRQQQALAQGYQQAAQIHAADRERALDAARAMGGLGGQRQALRLSDIVPLEQQGERRRAQQQGIYDTSYQDFLRQQGHPREALASHAAILHGVPQATTTYGIQQVPGAAQPNFLSNIGNVALGLAGANQYLGAGQGRKSGGSIRKKSNKGLGALNLNQSSMVRHPKVGGKFSLKRGINV